MAVTVPTGGHFLPQLRAATPIITCNALKVSLFVPVVKREFCGEAKKDLAGSSARGGAKTVGAEDTDCHTGDRVGVRSLARHPVGAMWASPPTHNKKACAGGASWTPPPTAFYR